MEAKQTEGQGVSPDTLVSLASSNFDAINSLEASNNTSDPEVIPAANVKALSDGKIQESKVLQSETTEQAVVPDIEAVTIPGTSDKIKEPKVPQSETSEEAVVSSNEDVETLPPSDKSEETNVPRSEIQVQDVVSGAEDIEKPPSNSKTEESKQDQPQVVDQTSVNLLEHVDNNDKMSTEDIPTDGEVHLAATRYKNLLPAETAPHDEIALPISGGKTEGTGASAITEYSKYIGGSSEDQQLKEPETTVGKFDPSDQINKSFEEAVTLGLGHYKIIMNEFVDSKKLYKTSDIIQYQQQARGAILEAFTTTFSPDSLNAMDPIIFYSYKNKLNECLCSPELTFTFLARYDHSTNTILKDLTKCTLEAEKVYDEEMEGFEPAQKSKTEIKERHILARQKAMEKFKELKPLYVDAAACSKEIEWKLQENLQDLSEEFAVLDPSSEQTNVEHELLQPAQNATQEINLGAFLDKESIYVNTIEADGATISEFCKLSLVDFNVPLADGAPAPGSTFNIYHLITENTPTNYQGISSSRSSDDIIKSFFCKLYSKIQTSWKNIDGKNDNNFQINLVITSAFPFTSYQKKRIKSSSLHYFRTTRVISSTTAIAVKYFFDTANGLDPRPLPIEQVPGTETVERIIVVHPVEESFTMAVVELKSGLIESKGCFGSLNYDAFNTTEFFKSHSNVFSMNTADNSIDQEKVLKAYKQVQEDLLKFCNIGLEINTVVLAGRESESSLLNALLKQLFENKELPIAKDCHIQGACLIARNISKEHKWLISDNTGGTFRVFVATERGQNSRELSGQGFGHYTVKTNEKLFVTVWEVLNPGKVVEACKYFLRGKPQPPEQLLEVMISSEINEDGVPGIIFDLPNASRGNIIDQHSLQEKKLGWIQSIWAKILGRNY
ncbi:unnamed protein product [Allacma fusca]|uniref:Uncharacterized protein n=1 Tax=Allacma fusca TaxID=39272 RepID=A0A8J2PJ40_9HEXA|nr:unnamed protein product [Allacma fusca]